MLYEWHRSSEKENDRTCMCVCGDVSAPGRDGRRQSVCVACQQVQSDTEDGLRRKSFKNVL